MFNYIKGLFNKKEVATIAELEKENKDLKKRLEASEKNEWDLYIEITDREKQEELELEELESTNEKCSCGSRMVPMYEEHPNWITICTNCDSRSENTNSSPILEPLSS